MSKKKPRPHHVTDHDERRLRSMLRRAYEGIAHDMGESYCEDRMEPTLWALKGDHHNRRDPKWSTLCDGTVFGSELDEDTQDWVWQVLLECVQD